MLQIPLTQNLPQTKQLVQDPTACATCSPFSSDNDTTAELDSAAMFAGLLNLLLNMDTARQAAPGESRPALMSLDSNLTLMQSGKTLPSVYRTGGNHLPPQVQLQAMLAAGQVPVPEAELGNINTLADVDLVKTNTAIEALIHKTPEQLELLQTLLPKRDLQSSILPTLIKNDLSSGLNLTPDHFNTHISMLNSINSFNQATPIPEQKPMLIDIQTPGWEKLLGERVIWVANQGMQGARIQLNPPELGPLKIDVAMDGEKVNVHFIAQNVQAKDAIDLSMPKLREMFQHSGIELADTQVFDQKSQHSFQQQSSWVNDDIFGEKLSQPDYVNDDLQAATAVTTVTSSSALIDTYV